MAEREREDPPAGDPNAPLPDDAPLFIRAFYNMVQELVDQNPEPSAREALQAAWDWMQTHIPERFLHPRPS